MRIVRNIEYVNRRKRVARWAAIGGFLLLGSTFFLAFSPQYILLAYMLLFVGFVIFNFGMQQVGKWNRSPRNDQIIDERMQPSGDKRGAGFSDRYVLIHYAQAGKRVVEHLLIHPGGVLVITARELPGLVWGRGGRWRKKGGGITRFFAFSGPQIGNPSFDTQASITAVERVLKDAQLEVDVSGAIVFVNPSVELDVEEPDFPTLLGEELPLFVRSLDEDPALSTAEREQLVQLLSGGAVEETVVRTRRPVKVKRRAA